MAISFQFILAVLHGCRILVPQPEIEPMIHAVEAWSHNHWTARKSLDIYLALLTQISCLDSSSLPPLPPQLFPSIFYS